MNESTISSKGQVTVPKAIRAQLHLQTGDRLRFETLADGSVRIFPATRDVSELRNILPRPKLKASLQELEAAVRRRAASRARR